MVDPLLFYALGTLAFWQAGIMVYREEIKKPYTESGTWVFLLGIVWPFFLSVVLSVILLEKVNQVFWKVFMKDLWR